LLDGCPQWQLTAIFVQKPEYLCKSSLSSYGRNLLNKVTIGVNTPSPATLGGGSYQSLNKGRVIGVEASFVY
jgi:hypothetical protein